MNAIGARNVGFMVPILTEGDGRPHRRKSEHIRDTGCQYSRTCIACPLAACKYDAPPPRTPRAAPVIPTPSVAAARDLVPVAAAVARLGITRRTLFRWIRSGRLPVVRQQQGPGKPRVLISAAVIDAVAKPG